MSQKEAKNIKPFLDGIDADVANLLPKANEKVAKEAQPRSETVTSRTAMQQKRASIDDMGAVTSKKLKCADGEELKIGEEIATPVEAKEPKRRFDVPTLNDVKDSKDDKDMKDLLDFAIYREMVVQKESEAQKPTNNQAWMDDLDSDFDDSEDDSDDSDDSDNDLEESDERDEDDVGEQDVV